MKLQKYSKLLCSLSFSLILFAVPSLSGEQISGQIVGTIGSNSNFVEFKPEELLIVDIDGPPEYQSGLELKFDIPPSIKKLPNSFALLVYKKITPSPNENQTLYSGNRVFMRLLPSQNSMFLRIPYYETGDLEGDALTSVLPVPINPDDFPLIVQFLPISKGMPHSSFSAKLRANLTELWKDEGSLTVEIENLSENSDETISLMVNDKEAPIGTPFNIAAGLHRIVLSSTHAPTLIKTIAIEPGQEERVVLSLDYSSPRLTVNIPDGSVVLLDGEPLNAEQARTGLNVEIGLHTITYTIGETQISREFTVPAGGNINIKLSIDIEAIDLNPEN